MMVQVRLGGMTTGEGVTMGAKGEEEAVQSPPPPPVEPMEMDPEEDPELDKYKSEASFRYTLDRFADFAAGHETRLSPPEHIRGLPWSTSLPPLLDPALTNPAALSGKSWPFPVIPGRDGRH